MTRDAIPLQPRVRLDRERIVRAVLELGIANFSMHRVARHLGVSATALYRHFDSREALIAGTMDALCERVRPPKPELQWPEYLRELAHAFRAALLEMPGAAAYGAAIGPATPAAFAILDAALGVLRRSGFDARDAWRAYSQVVSHTFNAVQGQERFAALEASNGPRGFRVYQLTPEEKTQFAHLGWVVDELFEGDTAVDFDAGFVDGLEIVLAGLVAKHGSRPPAA